MILLAGLPSDPIVQHIFKQLQGSTLPLAFVDQQQLGSEVNIDHTAISSIKQNWLIPHAKVQAVINRLVGFPNKDAHKHIKQLELLLHYLDDIYPNVLNKPSNGYSNISKPMQLAMLKLKACKIPNSIICSGTNCPSSTGMIFKSISSVRSIVRPLTTCNSFVKEPVLFQKQCLGYNVRVHCLGQMTTASKIISKDLDYRYGKQRIINNFKLPKAIAKECIDINQQLHLTFSGIDFIVQHNDWTLLEVNPAPGYAFFEKNDPNKTISKMLISYLKNLGI